jgi:hypothetical protein
MPESGSYMIAGYIVVAVVVVGYVVNLWRRGNEKR